MRRCHAGETCVPLWETATIRQRLCPAVLTSFEGRARTIADKRYFWLFMSRPSNSARVGPEADRGDAFPRSAGQGALRSQALSPLLTPYITPLTSRCSCRNPCVTSALCLRENNNSNTKTNSLADLFSVSSRKDCWGRALSATSCDVALQTSGAGCVVRKLSEQTLHAAK